MSRATTDIGRYVSSELLHLILLPTEQCNFRCSYCYEDFEHRRMTGPVVAGVKALLQRRISDLFILRIEWFGGEPLLAPSIIEDVMSHVRRVAREANPKLIRQSAMTTNGYLLTVPTLSNLVDLGVTSFQISLDGTRVAHDLRRPRADGGTTFDTIFGNLMAARDSSLRFSTKLRLHVDRENINEVDELLGVLGREIGEDSRFEIYIRPVGRLGGKNDPKSPVLGRDELGVVEKLKEKAAREGLALAQSGSEPCYAAAANSFVIRSTGEIAKCTVALRHSNNRLGYLREDGTATVDQAKLGGWVRGLLSGDREALRCPMRGFASNDCTARQRLRVIA